MNPFHSDHLGGVRFVINPHHPQKQDGWTEQRWPAHPMVVWIYRQISRVIGRRLDPDIVRRVPRMVDAEPLIHRRANIIYLSARQYRDFRNTMVHLQPGRTP